MQDLASGNLEKMSNYVSQVALLNAMTLA